MLILINKVSITELFVPNPPVKVLIKPHGLVNIKEIQLIDNLDNY